MLDKNFCFYFFQKNLFSQFFFSFRLFESILFFIFNDVNNETYKVPFINLQFFKNIYYRVSLFLRSYAKIKLLRYVFRQFQCIRNSKTWKNLFVPQETKIREYPWNSPFEYCLRFIDFNVIQCNIVFIWFFEMSKIIVNILWIKCFKIISLISVSHILSACQTRLF